MSGIHQTIRAELGNIKALGLLKPSFEDLDNYDLNIWETQVKGPTLQPGKGVLKSGPSYQSWATAEDDVLFQRYLPCVSVEKKFQLIGGLDLDIINRAPLRQKRSVSSSF